MNVDWDLLAEHLDGALAGTPEGARVERLVSTDSGWAQAASELSAAMESVAADLRTLPAPTMPDDIAARLDSALATATAPPSSRSGSPAAPDLATAGAPTGRSAGEPRRPPARPGSGRTRRQRRMVRLGGGLAVAAGVVAFAAVWFNGATPDLSVPGLVDEDSAGDGAAAPEEAPMEAERGRGLEPELPTLLVATGNDYDATTLPITEPVRPSNSIGGADRPSPPQQAPEATLGLNDAEPPAAVPEPLTRLWSDPTERAECLTMIMQSIQPPPVTITTVDFATYEGEAALVVWATAGDNSRWGWVSGPDCGAVPGNPDVQYQTQLS